MAKALIYVRVSTDRQAQKGLSIPAQKDKCLTYAHEKGYEVDEQTDIYSDEGESARTTKRPEFMRLWERCKADKNIKAVIVYDLSRFARDRIDFALVKDDLVKSGIKICSVTENIDETATGQFLEGMLSSVAEFYSRQSGEKISLGMLSKAQSGVWPNKAPFGYKNCRDGSGSDKDKRWIEVDEDEAIWVKKVFNLYITGKYSLRELANVLSKQNFPMRESKKLRQGFLHYIITNPIYIRKISYKGEVYDGQHPAIVDEAIFQKAQDILFERGKGSDRSQKHRFPLKSILCCAKCGAKYTGEQHKIKNGTIVRYLRCMKSIKGERVECGEKYFQEGYIAEQFEALFKQIQLPTSITERLRGRIKNIFGKEQDIYEKSRKMILKRLETIKKQKKDLVLNFINRAKTERDEELYGNIKNEFEVEETKLNNELNEVEGNLSQALKVLEIALVLSNNCFRAYKKANPELKGLLAKAFFEKVAISNGQIASVKLNIPLDYLVKNRVKNNPLFKLDNSGGRERI